MRSTARSRSRGSAKERTRAARGTSPASRLKYVHEWREYASGSAEDDGMVEQVDAATTIFDPISCDLNAVATILACAELADQLQAAGCAAACIHM